jgi:hypothetical protein
MFFLKKTKYNNYMIKKLFLPLALSLSVAYSASAQDSTMVKFDFASTADSAKVYNATLCQGAQMGQLWYRPLEERRLDTLDKRYLRLSQGTADIL